MILLSVASPFAVPITHRAEGEPLSLMCAGIVAAGALRRRVRQLGDEIDSL
jgi:hypothetical protein